MLITFFHFFNRVELIDWEIHIFQIMKDQVIGSVSFPFFFEMDIFHLEKWNKQAFFNSIFQLSCLLILFIFDHESSFRLKWKIRKSSKVLFDYFQIQKFGKWNDIQGIFPQYVSHKEIFSSSWRVEGWRTWFHSLFFPLRVLNYSRLARKDKARGSESNDEIKLEGKGLRRIPKFHNITRSDGIETLFDR